jgi:hypothetical protein
MTDVTPRLRLWIEEEFGDEATFTLRQLAAFDTEASGQAPERLLAAIAIEARARGLTSALELARMDWRDVLVVAGLGYEDWPAVLDDVLGGE